MPPTFDLPCDSYLEAEIDGEVRRFALTDVRMFRIGRSEKNNVVLVDELASRHHAMLQRSDIGEYYITDLGSSNGTFVNGARLSVPVILKSGDRISIGNVEFRFHQEITVEPPLVEPPDELKSTNILFRECLITVLVVDIRNFTGFARRIDSPKLSVITGAYFREAGKVIQERGAWAQKYIGDAVMAVWLHKKRDPELSEFAAVFDSLAEVTTIVEGLQSRFELDAPISVGAGINTGWASVGNVGSIASSDYTALGDVVNKAFRLEAATREMSCDLIMGEQTFAFLGGSIESKNLFEGCTLYLKGYDEPVTAYGANLSSLPGLLDTLRKNAGIASTEE